MDKALQEYIQYLLDQRNTLELTIVQLKKELNDLEQDKQSKPEPEGTDQTAGSTVA